VISICIPVYNFNVDKLVDELVGQAGQLKIAFEIILIDDCSKPGFREHNRKTCPGVIYVQLEQNIGRAAIRNRFLQYAQFGHLLFLDCDSLIIGADFLAKYIFSIQEHPDAVHCGGPAYSSEAPAREQRLRWRYGSKRECKPAAVRALQPAKSFMTGNFVVPREVFCLIRFDERLKDYGHEDTLFGLELKHRKIQLVHLDNPVINGHLEDNAGYLANTEKGIENLVILLQHSGHSGELIEDIRLLQVYHKLLRFRGGIGVLFSLAGPLIRFLLEKGIANLCLFDLYKLGLLHRRLSGRP
jgi:glycosyltransferase involved in cell wall biosynthesis